MNSKRLVLSRGRLAATLTVACLGLLYSAAQAQTLSPSTNPPSGVAGVNDSYVTGSGFPAGTITGATVVFGTGCSAPSAVMGGIAPVLQVSYPGNLRRFEFLIPSSLPTSTVPVTYYVWVTGTAGTTKFNTVNTPSCSKIVVTNVSSIIETCVPTSSLAVVVGKNVNAYVPFGYWSGGRTGIEEVPLEGTGTAANFATTGEVNSCAADSLTGEVVCTENSTNVDMISGSTLTTLTSGSNATAVFSGGSCENCGVAIDALDDIAFIEMGLLGGGGGPFGGSAGVQVLNLSNNKFNTAFPLVNYISEDIAIDPFLNLIMSPAENGIYDLLKIGAGNSLTEYGNNISGVLPYPYLDSAAEDCTTGIAMASDEDSDGVYITDLTQATFTSGSPGTWSAPGQFINLNDGGYSAGTSGISSAPGTGHLAVVTGEFGGSSYSALLLPSKSGSGTGTPTLADWAYVASMPSTPDGNPFSAGFDPHTIAAYTSPNTGKSYAVFADFADYLTQPPNYLGIVDLACVLAQPRTSGTHDVIGDASSCTRYVAIP